MRSLKICEHSERNSLENRPGAKRSYKNIGERESAKQRCEALAGYMIETGATVRAAAACFGVSKSTVHKDVTERLRYLNPSLYRQVQQILRYNKAERHLRGGEATRQKYLKKQMFFSVPEKKKNDCR